MRFAITVAFIVLCVSTTASAQVLQTKFLVSAGGATMTDGTTQLSANLGDIIVGPAISGTTGTWHGFWSTIPANLVGVNESKPTLAFQLRRAWPNPTRSMAFIEFSLPYDSPGSLDIYDIQGRLVKRLVQGPFPAGVYRPVWDLRDETGRPVSVGIYLYRLHLASFTATGKLVVLH
jgi:hypothetical protein